MLDVVPLCLHIPKIKSLEYCDIPAECMTSPIVAVIDLFPDLLLSESTKTMPNLFMKYNIAIKLILRT